MGKKKFKSVLERARKSKILFTVKTNCVKNHVAHSYCYLTWTLEWKEKNQDAKSICCVPKIAWYMKQKFKENPILANKSNIDTTLKAV